jgi:hypothetical protein
MLKGWQERELKLSVSVCLPEIFAKIRLLKVIYIQVTRCLGE